MIKLVFVDAKDMGGKQFSFTFVIDNESSEVQGLDYLINNNPISLIDKFMQHINELDDITKGEWWIEYSFPLCVFKTDQLEILKNRLATPCYVRDDNISTLEFDTKLNLIMCGMLPDEKLGQFGKDFKTILELEKYFDNKDYQNKKILFKKFPSIHCNSCNLKDKCMGGCPWFWNHCTFEDFMNFKLKENHNTLFGFSS